MNESKFFRCKVCDEAYFTSRKSRKKHERICRALRMLAREEDISEESTGSESIENYQDNHGVMDVVQVVVDDPLDLSVTSKYSTTLLPSHSSNIGNNSTPGENQENAKRKLTNFDRSVGKRDQKRVKGNEDSSAHVLGEEEEEEKRQSASMSVCGKGLGALPGKLSSLASAVESHPSHVWRSAVTSSLASSSSSSSQQRGSSSVEVQHLASHQSSIGTSPAVAIQRQIHSSAESSTVEGSSVTSPPSDSLCHEEGDNLPTTASVSGTRVSTNNTSQQLSCTVKKALKHAFDYSIGNLNNHFRNLEDFLSEALKLTKKLLIENY